MPCTKERLLIVDDEPSIRESLSSTLAEIGYPVRAAEDGLSALIEIRKEMPDVILSDLNMPGMSGFEFLSVVRRRFPAIPVIAMSGAFSGNEVPSGVAADAFYQKGSGVRSLLKIMERVLCFDRMPGMSAEFPSACRWFPQSHSGSALRSLPKSDLLHDRRTGRLGACSGFSDSSHRGETDRSDPVAPLETRKVTLSCATSLLRTYCYVRRLNFPTASGSRPKNSGKVGIFRGR